MVSIGLIFFLIMGKHCLFIAVSFRISSPMVLPNLKLSWQPRMKKRVFCSLPGQEQAGATWLEGSGGAQELPPGQLKTVGSVAAVDGGTGEWKDKGDGTERRGKGKGC